MRNLMLLVVLVTSGCFDGSMEDEGVAEDFFEVATTNGITANSLTTNSLTTNSITRNSLTTNSLTTNGLAPVANVIALDANSRITLGYIVSCALPAGSSVSVTYNSTTYVFLGALGVAPQWGTSSCNASCQEMVSACVISRINAYGTTVPLSARAYGAALPVSNTEAVDYPSREGAFYGNIFTSSMKLYACSFADWNKTGSWQARRCAIDNNTCGITYTGTCASACASYSEADSKGVYYTGYNKCVGGSDSYFNAVTTYLKPAY